MVPVRQKMGNMEKSEKGGLPMEWASPNLASLLKPVLQCGGLR